MKHEKPRLIKDGKGVAASCPGCGGFSRFLRYGEDGAEHGIRRVVVDGPEGHGGAVYAYRLLQCANCYRGALAITRTRLGGEDAKKNPITAGVIDVMKMQRADIDTKDAELVDFLPRPLQRIDLPKDVPRDLVAEIREAELCSSALAFRAASAMLRSALEKTLRANGYLKGPLEKRIEQAQDDGLITPVLARRAHDNVRLLGNDVLHDEWRAVDEAEFDSAHVYVQRIVEAFYDHRETAVAQLKAKGRLVEVKE